METTNFGFVASLLFVGVPTIFLIGLFIGNVNLRCVKSPHTLPPGWAEQDYKDQLKRALSILHMFVTEVNKDIMMILGVVNQIEVTRINQYMTF